MWLRIFVLLCWSFIAHAQLGVRIGTVTYAPPFVVATGRHHSFGFDIELMNHLCLLAGWECQYVNMPFPELFKAVRNAEVDLAIGAISITAANEEQVLTSLPYMASKGQFITLLTSPIHTIENITNHKLGMIGGRQYKDLLEMVFANKIQAVEFMDLTSLLQGLNNKKVDAIVFSAPMADYWLSANPNIYRKIGKPLSLGPGLGIIAAPGRNDLIQKINAGLLTLENDGTYLQLYRLYFGQSL